MSQLFEAIPITEKPQERGWYNLITDAHPSACGREYFDGNEFVLNYRKHNYKFLIDNGHAIYWLRAVDSQQPEIERLREVANDMRKMINKWNKTGEWIDLKKKIDRALTPQP